MEQPLAPKPNSNMVLAILTTLFCCLPFGIVSIIHASKVDGLYMSGQYDMAQMEADSAKKWGLIALGCGAVYCLFVFIYCIVVFVVAANS